MRKAKPMRIELADTGKRYNREWIFRHIDLQFTEGKKYAITGPNGSGKSTLLQVIAGSILHSEGRINYSIDHKKIEEPYLQVSFAAPYLELVEELTAMEALRFHEKFKSLSAQPGKILEETGLSSAANKQIRYFSSGMKQRLKLGQAFFSDTRVLMLDEPTTNLDAEGISLYRRLIEEFSGNRIVIISSNDEHEYDLCDEVIRITDYRS